MPAAPWYPQKGGYGKPPYVGLLEHWKALIVIRPTPRPLASVICCLSANAERPTVSEGERPGIRSCSTAVEALAGAFRPHLGRRLVSEGLLKIRGKFMSPGHWGPTAVAAFEELSDAEERAIRQRDAYERVNHLLEQLQLG